MSDPRKEFAAALMAERVVRRAVQTYRKSISGTNIRFWDEGKDAKTAALNLTRLMGGNPWTAVKVEHGWLIRSVTGMFYDADGKIPQHMWKSLDALAEEGHLKSASSLRLGPGVLDAKNSEALKRMKTFRKRLQGDANSAIEVAAGLAKKTGKDMYCWQGNSYMHAVWNVSAKESGALGALENIGQYVLRVTPELDLFKHEVLGRPHREKVYSNWSTDGMLQSLIPDLRLEGETLIRKLTEFHYSGRITDQELVGLVNEALKLGLLNQHQRDGVVKTWATD